jgi:hypothetical protein
VAGRQTEEKTLSTRVLATEAAHDAAVKMDALFDMKLAQSLIDLTSCLSRLSDPVHWDGPDAARFRHEWPRYDRSLMNALQAVSRLEVYARLAIDGVLRAGGDQVAPYVPSFDGGGAD